jgi:hypothetical protein
MLQIWMLTGDKLETATCIAKSSRLVSRTQGLHVFKSVVTRTDAHLEINTFRKKQDCALVISGDSLEVSEYAYIYLRIEKSDSNLFSFSSRCITNCLHHYRELNSSQCKNGVMEGKVHNLHSLIIKLYPLATDCRT